ncbi:uncharacterized protein RHIMIDRAFT_292618 [Rhizopus microsporus ATCC 52813]|uniref:Uncharacterized protein n=1 Tax=Rhizopus microsporus ATCC 52813 TaxID=1340429 RepID=A0A2G4STL4_RHIZD|nr:uncharacterized protein RHIMIDRAFT_292618 [Rhizopus microsporus ATCC 52813]PHZ11726.1 hypothetical protein RHIMIDRAFT_292618 [Rhizopus microsporus ATCC 52813]
MNSEENQRYPRILLKYTSELPTLKTENLTSFLLAASTLQNYQRIHNHYYQDKCSRRISTSKSELKKLLEDSLTAVKKHGTSSTVGAKHQNLNKSKHVPLPPADLSSSSQRKQIIGFGNGSFCSSMKGKRAAPIRRTTEEIKRKCKQPKGRAEFVYVDEYLTNQICNKCKMKEMNTFYSQV